MQRVALPIDEWLTDVDAAGGPLQSLVTRLTGGADRAVPAGRRSVSVTVRAAVGDTSPTITTTAGAAVLPEAITLAFSPDFPADELEALTIATVVGDDVMVVETFLA